MSNVIIIDANVIRNIAQGNRAAAEALKKLLKSGRRVYISTAAYNEVVGTKWALSEQYRALLKDLGIEVPPASSNAKMIKIRGDVYADNILQEPNPKKGIPGPMPEYGGKRDPISNMKTRPADAFVAAEAKALDAELWTLDQQFAKQARQQGVKIAAESAIPSVGGAEDVAAARQQLRPATPKPTPKPTPQVGLARRGMNVAKESIKLGIKGAFSAPSLASLLPDAILAIANKVAARDAIRKIQIKFIKEGFAKGFAAGLIGWTEAEVGSNLKNRVTHYRVQGLGDPAGYLGMAYILQLAEASENHAVEVGFHFSYQKTKEWRQDVRDKSLSMLQKQGYHFGGDPDALFEFDFIDKLAWVIRPTTNPIVEPAIRFH